MRTRSKPSVDVSGLAGAFTLVELLVVVSIIALLISILLPSLKQARENAKVVKCAASERAIGQSISVYLAESSGVYPPSYVYPLNEGGAWHTGEGGQDPNRTYGYVHWSYALYSSGKIDDKAFQCPKWPNGGAPRTNPGLEPEDWEPGQVDVNGQTEPNELEDRQATRMAYCTNAAVVPRNKFTLDLEGGQRVNLLPSESRIRRQSDTILGTEYLANWRALSVPEGGGLLVKAHRPINPFFNLGSGWNEYAATLSDSGFLYGENTMEGQRTYGMLPLKSVENKTNILDWTSGVAQINAVGRHHPGGDEYGGTANFLFCDGHVELSTAWKTMHDRRWGERYYALSGPNEVINFGDVLTFP
jgi:prepilin-type processing-associated H-X9-DG protein/prepilin-type N-terminal cleavage/methylation domain-containing protein